MSKVRVAGFGMSIDGFSAGLRQSLDEPLGENGREMFQWFFGTRPFCAMLGKEGGSVDLDDQFAHRAMENFGALSSAGTCSVLFGDHGLTTRGRDGGETIPPTTHLLSY